MYMVDFGGTDGSALLSFSASLDRLVLVLMLYLVGRRGISFLQTGEKEKIAGCGDVWRNC